MNYKDAKRSLVQLLLPLKVTFLHNASELDVFKTLAPPREMGIVTTTKLQNEDIVAFLYYKNKLRTLIVGSLKNIVAHHQLKRWAMKVLEGSDEDSECVACLQPMEYGLLCQQCDTPMCVSCRLRLASRTLSLCRNAPNLTTTCPVCRGPQFLSS
jgi:hypothetical protein